MTKSSDDFELFGFAQFRKARQAEDAPGDGTADLQPPDSAAKTLPAGLVAIQHGVVDVGADAALTERRSHRVATGLVGRDQYGQMPDEARIIRADEAPPGVSSACLAFRK